MRRPRTVALAAAALLAVAAAGWWLASPWWTLWRMREAAEAGDSQALSAYVEFPALRASTRAQLGAKLGPLGGLVAGRALDAAISPEALALALGNGRGRASGGANATPGGVARGPDSEARDIDLARTGASEFRVKGRRSDLVFRRHGLGWKLEEIRLSSAP